MANDNIIIENHSKVNTLLDSFRISEAISLVKAMLHETHLNSFIDNASRIEETYKYMIHYLLEGARDEGRDRLLADIVEQLRSLSDRALRESRSVSSSDYYYSVLRFNNLRGERLSEIIKEYGNVISEMSLAELGGNDVSELRKKKEEYLVRIFNSIFISLGSYSDYAELTRYLNSGYADENITAQSLSAMTLSLLCFYDRGKFNALLDVYENSASEKIAARTLVGILLSMICNAARIQGDPLIMSRLSLWNDSIETYRRLHEVIRIIVGTRDTERVATKMKDEVIPELMKLRPDIMKTIKEESGEIDPSMFENNPEWEELLAKSDLTKKMQELSDMQSDGADLMMVTFSNLKQFPFFNTAANWFLPFDSRHSDLALDDDMRQFVDFLKDAGNMVCDSDMYSLALAATRMPEAQRNMISNQFSAQFSQMKEEVKSSVPKSTTPEFDTEALKYVRDLYRFFKLFRKKEGLYDPFSKPLQFTELPVVGEIMADNEVLELIGEFYFKRGYYADALPLFVTLSKEKCDDASLWEKIGFCHQAENRIACAKEAYDKAALLKTAGPWLTKKLAFVNRKLGNYAEAARYYDSALEMDPDNVSLIMNAGNMLLATGDVGNALGKFYHANYLRSADPRIMRAIAWAELLNKNFVKSSDYYRRIISIKADSTDYLNAGHAALLQSENKEAVNFYRLAAKDNKSDFELAYSNDMAVLESLGADRNTLLLILDTVLA